MIPENAHHLATLTAALHFPDADSLKAKRMILRGLKDRISAKFNVSVCEAGGQDKWQYAVVVFAQLSSDKRHLDSCLQNLLSTIEQSAGLYLCEHSIEYY